MLFRTRKLTLCRAMAALIAVTAMADDWPVFRGTPDLAGCSSGPLRTPMKRVWSFAAGDAIRSSPIIVSNRVFVGSDDGCVYAVDLADGGKVWSRTTGGPVEAPPLYLDGRVIVGSDDGLLYALSAGSGEVVWTYRTGARITGSANWVQARRGARLIVVGSYDMSLHAVDAATGTGVWTCASGGYVNGAPAVAGQRVAFGGCDMTLRLLDAGAGTQLMSIAMGSYVPAGPVFQRQVFVGDFGGDVLCADPDTGTVAWKMAWPDAPVFTVPAVNSQHVVYGARDMNLRCLRRDNGALVWSFAAKGDIDSSPVIAGERVVFGADDGRLHVLSLKDGAEVWSYDVGRPIKSSPAVAHGRVVIGCDDGHLYAFAPTTSGDGGHK